MFSNRPFAGVAGLTSISRGIGDKGIGALPLSYAGTKSRGRIRTCDLPLNRRSNPCLHHRPNLGATTSQNSPGNLREEISTRGRGLRQPCASGRRPQILADPGVAADQHLGRVRNPASSRRFERSNSSLSPPAKVTLHARRARAPAPHERRRPCTGNSQGTWNTVEGSNPGLGTGTPRSCRELHH
jgi:hypothetical protein